jgi:hypothetical protein
MSRADKTALGEVMAKEGMDNIYIFLQEMIAENTKARLCKILLPAGTKATVAERAVLLANLIWKYKDAITETMGIGTERTEGVTEGERDKQAEGEGQMDQQIEAGRAQDKPGPTARVRDMSLNTHMQEGENVTTGTHLNRNVGTRDTAQETMQKQQRHMAK